MFQQLVNLQRETYLAFAGQIKAFAAGGGWPAFLAFLPTGIVFGAVHVTTAGHSKSMLATYLAGSSTRAHRALLVPCPLTLFVMTFAMIHQVVVTGLLFALTMMMGVGLTPSVVALLAVTFRDRIGRLMRKSPHLLEAVSRLTGALAGLVLVSVAAVEISNWATA